MLQPFSEGSSIKKISVEVLNFSDGHHLCVSVILFLSYNFSREAVEFSLVLFKGFPEELFSVLRTVHLLRGLSVGMGLNYSCAKDWRPIAEEALFCAGRLQGIPLSL